MKNQFSWPVIRICVYRLVFMNGDNKFGVPVYTQLG